MDGSHYHKPKTVPIRRRQGEGSSARENNDIEGTFITLQPSETRRDFINPKFGEDEDEDVVQVVDLQSRDKPPLFLLFPDLEKQDKEKLAATTSTTQVTQILCGKKADFSLLKPSKKLHPEQCRLPALIEHSSDEDAAG